MPQPPNTVNPRDLWLPPVLPPQQAMSSQGSRQRRDTITDGSESIKEEFSDHENEARIKRESSGGEDEAKIKQESSEVREDLKAAKK